MTFEGHEILQSGQGPINAGRGDLQGVFPTDRIGGVHHFGDRPGEPGAVFDHHVAIRLPLGHDLQLARLGTAHQAQTHQGIAQRFGHGVEQFQQV